MIKTKSINLSIDDIVIPDRFKKTMPSQYKIAQRMHALRTSGSFDREIIVDENNILLDGYTVYLVCKMLSITGIRCIRVKSTDMTANAYQKAALRTAGTENPSALLFNGVMGLNGEAGECIDLLKKVLFQGHELDHNELAKELGDVAWYLAVAAHAIGFDLETVLQMNIDKLKARYPDGFDPERSTHRSEEVS